MRPSPLFWTVLVAVGLLLGGCNIRSEYDAPLIGKDDVERLAAEAGFSPEQRTAAERLASDYASEHAAALEKIQLYREAYDKLAERGSTPELEADYKATTARYERFCLGLRDRFFEDARALIAEEQRAGWERFERWYRRKVLVPKGVLHGESVDLVALVEQLRPPAVEDPRVAELLAAYSIDLDAGLTARQEAIARSHELAEAEPAARERAEARIREQRGRVRTLNFRMSRELNAVMPEPSRSAFQRAFDEAAFPEVFADIALADAVFAEVMGLSDLTGEQRAEVEVVRHWYWSERPAVDRRWASAIRAAEDRNPVRVEPGTEALARQPENVRDGRRPRQELDLKCRARLEAILTSSQLDRLPWLPSRPRLPRVEFE